MPEPTEVTSTIPSGAGAVHALFEETPPNMDVTSLNERDNTTDADTDAVANLDDDSVDAAQDKGEGEKAEGEGDTKVAADAAPEKEKVAADTGDALKALAAELKLDAETDKDLLNAILSREGGAPKEDAQPQVDVLADLFKELDGDAAPDAGKAADAPAADPNAAQPAADNAPLRFGDVGDEWESMDDGFNALRTSLDPDEGDPKQVGKVFDALSKRHTIAFAVPIMRGLFEDMVKEHIQSEVGEFVPIAKQIRSRNIQRQSEDRAQTMLEAKFGKDFSAMFEEDGGPDIVHGGKKWNAIPYNRIVQEFPYIMQIEEKDSNPEKAALKTTLAQFNEAFKLHNLKQQKLSESAKAAQELVDAGAKSKERERSQATRTRQQAGAGSGTNGKLKPGPAGEESEEEELARISRMAGGASIRKLFGE